MVRSLRPLAKCLKTVSAASGIRVCALRGRLRSVFRFVTRAGPLLPLCSCAAVQAGSVAGGNPGPAADVPTSEDKLPAGFFEEAQGLEIVPSTVFVVVPASAGTPTRFELRARLWREHADLGWILVPESYGHVPEWEVAESWVKIVKRTAHRVTLEISDHPPLPYEVTVKATVDFQGEPVTAEASMQIIADNHASDSDKIVATHGDEEPAAVAVVEGQLDTGVAKECTRGNTVAFVRGGVVGNYVWGCDDARGSVSVFSIDHAMARTEFNWSSAEDSVDVTGGQHSLTTLPVKIWVADTVGPAVTETIVQAFRKEWNTQTQIDVWLANWHLRLNRAGIRFSIVAGGPEFTDIESPAHCTKEIAPHVKGVLNVYYVSQVLGGRALFCGRSTSDGERDWDVVLVDRGEYVSATLLHEFGHALGLINPGVGHTNGLAGFRGNNVMWGHEVDVLSGNRNHFSVGQIFRMNLEESSLINRSLAVADDDPLKVNEQTLARAASELRLRCQCRDDVAEPCPLLRADVNEYEFPEQSNDGRGCCDRVELFNTTGEHHGVGLIRGHLWRAEPGKCEWVDGVPWRQESHHRLSLLFPNLSSDPVCDNGQNPPSKMWDLAVFFAEHRMEYTEVTRDEPLDKGGFASTNGDFIHAFSPPSDPPNEPWIVPVSVWHQGASATGSTDDDVKTADKIFRGEPQEGVQNYTGIDFRWELPQQGPSWEEDWPQLAQLMGMMVPGCPVVSSGMKYVEVGAVNVYYHAKTAENYAALASLEEHRGWSCMDAATGTAFIVMSPFEAYSNTSLAHHLGHVLGLDGVSDADGLAPSNLMWEDPLHPMGLDARLELTLGQVFRMNLDPSSWLNASPLSDRKKDPTARTVDCSVADACPPITADTRTNQEIP